MKRLGAALAFAVLAIFPRASRADEAKSLDAPASPTLPALAHRSLTYTLEFTGAGIRPTAGAGASRELATSWLAHSEVEYPIIPRAWYLGAAHDVAASAVPGVGSHVFLGSPEIWGRGVWSSLQGLSAGGGFGVVIPTPRDLSPSEHKVFDTLRVVRPWDAAYFTDLTLTVRPFFDIRHLAGRFILQLRQGLDIAVDLRDLARGQNRTDYAARTTFYVGFRIAEPIGVGLELWEVYQITADIPDDKRAAFALSPSIRFVLPRVEPAVSVLFPITTPLKGEAASYFAARINVSFEFDAKGKGPS